MSIENTCPLCGGKMTWKPGKGLQGTVAKCCGVLWSYLGTGSAPSCREVTGPNAYLKACKERGLLEFLSEEDVAALEKKGG